MKLFLTLLVAVAFVGCSKSNDDSGKFCWSCEVTRWTDNVTMHKDTCTRNNYAPQFKDANGNDENAICQEK